MSEKTDTLGDALPREMARVRELIPLYDAVPMGYLAAGMMRQSLDVAARALAEGDVSFRFLVLASMMRLP